MKPASSFSIPRRGAAWFLLISLTLIIFALGETLRLPAVPLLAGIAGGGFLALRQADVHIPAPVFNYSQCILGLMISLTFTPDVLKGLLDNWIMAIAIVAAILLFGLAGGVLITVRQWLPGTTGIWGISPGGAAAMIVMSEAYGGDMRLVAIMQYLRVMIVAFVAVGVARILGPEVSVNAETPFPESLFPPTDAARLALTLAVAAICCFLARLSRIPAASFLLPMLVGAALNSTGAIVVELPGWLLTLDFMLIGWSIGLRFDRDVLAYAYRAFPQILGAIFFMIGSAGALAVLLVVGWDIDPMTAYLATSPGGADAVAIIAASSGGDMVFIMAAQTFRLLVVILFGPYLARAAAHIVRNRLKTPGERPNE